MPTYHYRCTTCEQHLEVVQSMRDDPVTECAACGGQMVKVLRPVGIVLKGSGFYRTDNRAKRGASEGSKGESKPATKEAGSKPSSESSSSKTADTKTGDTKTADTKTA